MTRLHGLSAITQRDGAGKRRRKSQPSSSVATALSAPTQDRPEPLKKSWLRPSAEAGGRSKCHGSCRMQAVQVAAAGGGRK